MHEHSPADGPVHSEYKYKNDLQNFYQVNYFFFESKSMTQMLTAIFNANGCKPKTVDIFPLVLLCQMQSKKKLFIKIFIQPEFRAQFQTIV